MDRRLFKEPLSSNTRTALQRVTPQGAAEHGGTWGLRGCDGGEMGAGGPQPAACQPFSLSTEPVFPPHAVQASACRLGLGAPEEGQSYPGLLDNWALEDARLPC